MSAFGKPTDAEASSGDGTFIALLKRARTLLNGGLPAALDAGGSLKVGLSAATAGEVHIGEVGYPLEIVTATPVLDTSIYASGDVLWTTSVALTNLLRVSGGKAILRSITIVDEDDQGVALDLFFFRAAQSLGTVNAAPNISDANARDCLGFVSFVAGDYIDLGGARVAHKANLATLLTGTASRDVHIGAITRGTPTYTASGLKISVGVEQG